MLTSRFITNSDCNQVSVLSDRELCVALAREAMGWERVWERDGILVGEHSFVMTALPLAVPEWTNDDEELANLSLAIIAINVDTGKWADAGNIAGTRAS